MSHAATAHLLSQAHPGSSPRISTQNPAYRRIAVIRLDRTGSHARPARFGCLPVLRREGVEEAVLVGGGGGFAAAGHIELAQDV